MNVVMFSQKCIDALGLVRRKVIRNDVNLFARRLVHHELGEKRHEFRRRMPSRCLTHNLARPGVESRTQRQRAVATRQHRSWIAVNSSGGQIAKDTFANECLMPAAAPVTDAVIAA